ncbi:SEC-C metal-binding domain-containing protein [Porticoccaceae bacterium]|nr:SEC-C metal-binding domain-containing protein [Porticoccaceae bacterium]
MPLIPAFCDNCGAAFSSGIFIDNCTNISLHSNKSGPCPRCGGMGSVLDGVFNVIGDVIERISSIRENKDVLIKASEILTRAVEVQASSQEVAKEIRRDTPEISNLADVLPKTRIELYAFLTLILFIIATILANADDSSDTEELLEKALERSMQPQYFIPYEPPRRESRNTACSCGSGKRFKHCCGVLI